MLGTRKEVVNYYKTKIFKKLDSLKVILITGDTFFDVLELSCKILLKIFFSL